MGRGGSGAFFLGLAIFVVGVGASVFTYMNAGPGGTYVVFVGLIVGGLIRMVTALVAGGFGASAFATRPDKKRKALHQSAWYEDPSAEYVEKLADVPSGHCWQCGSKIRRGRTICMACGAAQNSAAPKSDTSATPGGKTFGPPPKLAKSIHPYDIEESPEPEPQPQPRQAQRPRGYFPADPDGSYGWGPAYGTGGEPGGRSNPGYQPGEQPRRFESGDARRYVAPPPEREAPRPGRSYGASGPSSRHSGDLPPISRRYSGPLDEGDQPPPRRATRDDEQRRQPPRGQRPYDEGWDDEDDGDYQDRRRASSPRHAARPRPQPRPSYGRDDDGWDDESGRSSSSRHPRQR